LLGARIAAAALCLLLLPGAARAQTGNSQAPHPRLGLYGNATGSGFPFVRADHTINPTLLDSVARYDTVILPASPFTEYNPQVLAGLRARHPGIKLYAYVQGDFAYVSAVADSFVHIPTRHYRLVRDLGGFLYDRVGLPFAQANINLANRDTKGHYAIADSMADFFANAVWRTGLWDGIFLDRFCTNIEWQQTPAESLDFARAGYATLVAFDTAWAAGSNELAARLRADVGAAPVLVGNCGQSTQYATMNGWMHEDFPNQNGGTWNQNFFRNPGGYTADEAHFRAPQSDWLVAWPTDLAHPYNTDGTRRARYTLGTASLEDGFATINPPDLDVNRNYLDWWYDEYAVDLTTGRASGRLTDAGWLGAALGAYTSLPSLGPIDATGANPGFELNTLGWTLVSTSGASLTRDLSNPIAGVASGHVSLPSAGTGTVSTRLTTLGYLTLWAGSSYRISFWIRAVAPRQVTVAAVDAYYGTDTWSAIVAPTATWQHYDLDFVAPSSGAIPGLQFRLGGAADDVWIDDAHFTQSGVTLYQRNFQRGTVLVNPTAVPLSASLDHACRRILGTVDPLVNDGTAVTLATVPPFDALFLLNTTPIVGVTDDAPGVAALSWRTAGPNPLLRGTWLSARLALPRAGDCTLDVFDARGRRVRALGGIAGRPGDNVVSWDGRGDFGQTLPRGLYFLRAAFAGERVTRKVVLE